MPNEVIWILFVCLGLIMLLALGLWITVCVLDRKIKNANSRIRFLETDIDQIREDFHRFIALFGKKVT